MSLMVHHSLMTSRSTTVSYVRSTVYGMGGVNPFTFNVGSITPTGNLMVISVQGIQSRSITSITGSWSSEISISGGGTCALFYRIANSEPGTTYTITLSGGLNPGAVYYYEFSGVSQSSPFLSSLTNSSGSNVTSLAFASFNMSVPGVIVSLCTNSLTTSPQWQCDNSYNNFSASSACRAAYKIYQTEKANELVTWSGGTSAGVQQLLAAFRAQKI